jgi:hypothetical protein
LLSGSAHEHGRQYGSESRDWSGARDLNPGPHGPEICAVSSIENVFEGFEFISSTHSAISGQFHPPSSPGLLHELLHGTRMGPASPDLLNAMQRVDRHRESTRVVSTSNLTTAGGRFVHRSRPESREYGVKCRGFRNGIPLRLFHMPNATHWVLPSFSSTFDIVPWA